LKQARGEINDQLSKIQKSRDPDFMVGTTAQALEQAKDAINSVMKSIPEQKRADKMFSAGDKAKAAMFESMQFGTKGTKKIDIPTVKKLFQNNDKAYRMKENVEVMKMFLDKFGKNIPKARRQQMIDVVNRFEQMQKIAVDRGIVQSFRQAQGPTSPVLERTESLRAAKGLPYQSATFPAGMLNAHDEFVKAAVNKYGLGKIENAHPKVQDALTKAFIWKQEHDKATPFEVDAITQKFLKGAK
jgi:hypothetical protein